MWGNFMEKAKDLASNLDKQINESVGLEADSTPATASATIASEGEKQSGDAWNDDFDFDDEEGKELPQEDHVEKVPLTTPVSISVHVPECVPESVPTSSPLPEPISESIDLCPPIEPVMEMLAPEKIPEPVGYLDSFMTMTATADATSPSGLEVIDNDFDGNADKDDDEMPVGKKDNHIQEPIVPGSPIQEPVEPSLCPAEPTPPLVVHESPPVSPIQVPTQSSPSPKQGPAFASNMFSSLAHRAEAFAHQAESLVQLPSHRTGTDANKPMGTNAISSLLSAFPIATTSSSKIEQNASGWAEDVDENLDLDDEKDETNVETPSLPVVETEALLQNQEPTNIVLNKLVVVDSPKEIVLAEATEAESVPPPTLLPTSSLEPTAVISSKIEDDPRYQHLLKQLQLREEQLSNKSNQLTQLQDLMEQQERDLTRKIHETKEEAKKRIMRAKERCDAAEAKVQQLQSVTSADAASQSQMIQALREEGEKLAHKQSAMEQVVRAAKLECRDLTEHLEAETNAKRDALAKIVQLESDLKTTKDFLSAARKGESQASKLEQDLLSARSDAELKGASILSLQQQIKELNAEGKELQEELKRTRKEAQQAAQQEKKTLRQEHHDMINDLEAKLRTTEREAGVREDALRHEVSELRKRWQDAVRRADALSMDVQSSTAPLLRQLESMERQNRARAANWAELESRLRSELEDTVIQNETLSKERSEFKTKYTRLERLMNEQEQDLKQAKRMIEEQTAKISKLEAQVEEMEGQAQKREEEYSKVERLANEGVMRVRSEMTQTVVDSEERYRGQIDKLEKELRVEHEKRSQLEGQVEQLLENAGMFVAPRATETIRLGSKPKKLRQAEGQAEILAGALGFDSDTDDDEDEDGVSRDMDRGEAPSNSLNSFAALEQLTSRLRAAKIELDALRRNLRESEHVRESLVEELGESRTAKEKLPLFEAKVKELSQENREKELEIQGLREDIADVREMYRTQLNLLLEEKAASQVPTSNGVPEVSD